MAEGIIAKAIPEVRVESAGTHALIGRKADPVSVQIMHDQGIDITSHIARQLSLGMCQRADLILVMDTAQRKYVEEQYPTVRGKVFRIADSMNKDVDDPYKLGLQDFKRAHLLIEDGAKFWIDRIKKITAQNRR